MYKVTITGNLVVIEDVCRPKVLTLRGKRGVVDGMSKGSRGRFIRKVNSLIFDADKAVFVTLTYHNNQDDARSAKRDLRTLIKRLHRRHPDAGFVWVAERQKRGAIHFHLLFINGKGWENEISKTWHAITDTWSRAHFVYGVLALPADGSKAVSYLASYLSKGGLRKGDGRAWGMEYCKQFMDYTTTIYVRDEDINLDMFKGVVFEARVEWGYHLGGNIGRRLEVDKILKKCQNGFDFCAREPNQEERS